MSSYDWESVGVSIVVFFLSLIFSLFGAWIGIALWGTIMVRIFNLPQLTFWQFYGLMLLIRILLPNRRNLKVKE